MATTTETLAMLDSRVKLLEDTIIGENYSENNSTEVKYIIVIMLGVFRLGLLIYKRVIC